MISANRSNDALAFRSTLGRYASGITIIGGLFEGKPVGFTCQSFYSVSVDPPLVSFSVMKTSKSWPVIRKSNTFSVNILSHAQRRLAEGFGSSRADRWAGVAWRLSNHNNPIIDGSLAWLDCEIHDEYEAGDHWIVVGRLREMSSLEHSSTTEEPLVFFRGKFRYLSRECEATRTDEGHGAPTPNHPASSNATR